MTGSGGQSLRGPGRGGADPGKQAAAPHFSVPLISGGRGLGCHTEATMAQKMGPQHPPSAAVSLPMEKEMAVHSSTLARTVPWVGEPGGLQSMASQRVKPDSGTSTLHTPYLFRG